MADLEPPSPSAYIQANFVDDALADLSLWIAGDQYYDTSTAIYLRRAIRIIIKHASPKSKACLYDFLVKEHTDND